MNRWKLPLAAAVAASLAVGAVPASAATFANGGRLKAEINQLDRQVERAQARHQITYREARMLNQQVRQLDRTWRVYARGGFSRGELNTLNRQIDRVQNNFNRQLIDRNDHRYDRDRGHRR